MKRGSPRKRAINIFLPSSNDQYARRKKGASYIFLIFVALLRFSFLLSKVKKQLTTISMGFAFFSSHIYDVLFVDGVQDGN